MRQKIDGLSLSRHMMAAALFVVSLLSVPALAVQGKAGPEEALIDVGGYKLNSVLVPAKGKAELPPIVFIHGASANLYDPMLSFRDKLEGRADLLFVDRPGHGHSQRGGPENASPDGQADAIAALMQKRGIKKAIIVSHSFGGAVAAAFALRHPDRVIGLVFLSPAVYPWPGGVAWYYDAAKAPVTGWLFSGFVAPTVGLALIDKATKSVFAPNHRPDGYVRNARTLSVLRPAEFRNNAIDVSNLLEWTKKTSPRYGEITKPTIIITGDTDTVVSPTIHSRHLSEAIRGARLISIHNLGHKSDYVVSDVAVAAIETIGGEKRNLGQIASAAEARIAGDNEK